MSRMTSHTLWSRGGRRLFAAMMLAIGAGAASPAASMSQVVTLPTARITRSGPEALRLWRLVDSVQKVYSGVDSAKRGAARVDSLLTIATIAPLSQARLQAFTAETSSERKGRVLAGVLARQPDRVAAATVRELRAEVNGLFSRESRLETVSRFDVDELIGTAAFAEQDQARRALLERLGEAARAAIIEREIGRPWAPVRSREAAAMFWRQPRFSTLNVGAVSFDHGGAAFTELATPFLHALRVSVNAVIAGNGGDDADGGEGEEGGEAAADEGADQPTIDRFVNGGGTLNVGFAWPVLHVAFPRDAFDGMLLLAPRIGGTPPGLTSDERDDTLLGDAGVELHLKSVDATDGIGVLLQSRYAWAGGSGEFGQLVGMKGENRRFDYVTVSAGLLLGGKYLVTASRVLEGPKPLRDLKWQVGVTAMRGPDK